MNEAKIVVNYDEALFLAAARELANLSLAHVEKIADEFCAKTSDQENAEMRELLQDVSYNIMKIAVEKELKI
jgi:hypothetical protein